MPSMIFPIEDELKLKIDKFLWVNWSEVAREESLKRDIFERFIKTGTLSKEDQEFCDRIDWYPIDELEVREEYIEKLKKRIEKEPSGKSMSLKEFNKWCDSL